MSERVPDFPVPETGARDVAEVVLAGAVNLIPGAGGWLAAGTQKLFAQQEQARLTAYLNDLAAVVNELVNTTEGLTAENLVATTEFYDAAVESVRIALSSASHEKHRALRNALYHVGTAGEHDADADLRSVFLRCIDELTDTHIKLLRGFGEVRGDYFQLEQVAPVGSGADARIFAADLQARGLIEERPVFTQHPGGGMAIYASAIQGGMGITALGSRFLEFVSGPFDAERPDTPGAQAE